MDRKRAMLLCLVLATPLLAVEWSVVPMVGYNAAEARLGFCPGDPNTEWGKVTIGPLFKYMQGLNPEDSQGIGPGFFGAYDLVQDAKFSLYGMDAVVSWYGGVEGTLLFREAEAVRLSPVLMTGMFFGRRHVKPGATWAASFGVEEQYLLPTNLATSWFADLDRKFQTLVFAQITWR